MNRSARLLALPVALVLSATLSGCGTGFDAATNRPYTPSNGTSLTIGTMDARNLLLVQDATRPGTFHLIGALVNSGPDPEVLTKVEVKGASAVPLTPITVPGRSIITTGGTTTGNPQIDVPGATFKVGEFTEITLTYQDGGSGTASLLALTPEGVVSGG